MLPLVHIIERLNASVLELHADVKVALAARAPQMTVEGYVKAVVLTDASGRMMGWHDGPDEPVPAMNLASALLRIQELEADLKRARGYPDV